MPENTQITETIIGPPKPFSISNTANTASNAYQGSGEPNIADQILPSELSGKSVVKNSSSQPQITQIFTDNSLDFHGSISN